MRKTLILAIVVLLTFFQMSFAEVPGSLNYQGRLVDDIGNPYPNDDYLIKFIIYNALTDGDIIWDGNFQTITLVSGLFQVNLGESPMPPLPDDIFKNNIDLYLGISVGTSAEIQPRTKITSVGFAYHSFTSDTADYAKNTQPAPSRDLYHNIMDINPNSSTSIPILIRTGSETVKLYLYGDEFQGALASHTHTGNNAHAHNFSGTVNSTSVAHTHSLSGSTLSGGVNHTHSGNTGYFNTSHRHTGTTNKDGWHYHDFIFTGYGVDHQFLTHKGDYNGLTAHGAVQQIKASASVDDGNSEHTHNFTTGYDGSNHRHSFTTGSASAYSHTHGLSGNTGSHNISHSHTFEGATFSFGAGLATSGIENTSVVGSISVYVDGELAAGPFSGSFASGELDLTSFISGSGEHFITIQEEGGSGGRITYNLFVE